jgi:hypothetical protein
MTASQSPFGRSDTASRGLILIVIAVALGLLFLWKAYDDGAATVAPGTVDDGIAASTTAPVPTVTTADGGTATVPPTTTLPAAIANDPRPPAEVKVLIANATGESGIAGSLTDDLKAAAYTTESPANAPTGPASKIYYKLGYAADAREVAGILNSSLSIVEQAPASSQVNDNAADRWETANVIVVVGSDQAVPYGTG